MAGTQKIKEDLLVSTLLKTAAEHLLSDAPQPLVLGNQILREEMAELLPQLGLKSYETEVSSAVDDVWSARNDPKLWKRLDSTFKDFQAVPFHSVKSSFPSSKPNGSKMCLVL